MVSVVIAGDRITAEDTRAGIDELIDHARGCAPAAAAAAAGDGEHQDHELAEDRGGDPGADPAIVRRLLAERYQSHLY